MKNFKCVCGKILKAEEDTESFKTKLCFDCYVKKLNTKEGTMAEEETSEEKDKEEFEDTDE